MSENMSKEVRGREGGREGGREQYDMGLHWAVASFS